MKWKIALAAALLAITGLRAELSYMDTIKVNAFYYKATSRLVTDGPRIVSRQQPRGLYFLRRDNPTEYNQLTNNEPFTHVALPSFTSTEKMHTAANTLPLLGYALSKTSFFNKERKVKYDNLIKYNAWYNEDMFYPTSDYSFVTTHLAKPATFCLLKEGMDTLAESETGKRIAEYIPKEYREEVVEHGTFVAASALTELSTIAAKSILQKNETEFIQESKKLGKQIALYSISQKVEKCINPPVEFIAEKIAGPGEGWTKTGLCLVANWFVLSELNSRIKKI